MKRSVLTFTAAIQLSAAVMTPAGAADAGGNAASRVRLAPVEWPSAEMLSPEGKAWLREERRVFAEELRKLKEWIPPNMRGAASKSWGPWKTMLSESHAIEYVPEMPAVEVEAIIRAMEKGALDTVSDNQERFQQALAKRIPTFADAVKHYRAGHYDKAVAALKPLTKEDVLHAFHYYQYDTMPPYIYSAVTMFEGACYGMNGALHNAFVRYLIVYNSKLPGSMSFAATARWRCAAIYEQSSRAHFAIPIYQNLAMRYRDKLSDSTLLKLNVRYRRMMMDNPFRQAVKLATQVTGNLLNDDTGAETQTKQKGLTARMATIINDLEKDGRGHSQVNWEMTGFEINEASLQEGTAPGKFNFEKDVDAVGSDNWGKLRPREQQELMHTFMERFADEYRPLIEAYYREMSRQETGK
jgi:hypothetical protein